MKTILTTLLLFIFTTPIFAQVGEEDAMLTLQSAETNVYSLWVGIFDCTGLKDLEPGTHDPDDNSEGMDNLAMNSHWYLLTWVGVPVEREDVVLYAEVRWQVGLDMVDEALPFLSIAETKLNAAWDAYDNDEWDDCVDLANEAINNAELGIAKLLNGPDASSLPWYVPEHKTALWYIGSAASTFILEADNQNAMDFYEWWDTWVAGNPADPFYEGE